MRRWKDIAWILIGDYIVLVAPADQQNARNKTEKL